jgi:integrase/recombinase XerD
MAQASVLIDTEIRRVFRIIETTRHAEPKSIGLRPVRVCWPSRRRKCGEARREIKLGAHQTKGSKGRTVVLSNRVRSEIDAHLKNRPILRHDAPLISSQRNGRPFSNVSLSMLFKEIYESAGIRTSSHSGRRTFATRLNAKGVGMRTIQKLMGHRHIGTTALYCDVSEDTLRNAVELV